MLTTNGIIDAAQPALDYLLKLPSHFLKNDDVSLESVRGNLVDIVHKMEIDLEKLSGMRFKIETIKYIVTALADETLIFSKWRHADEWKKHSLEKEIFNTNVSGERFFELLEKKGFVDPQLAELFYICLCLGFGRKRADIFTLKHKLYMIISHRLPDDERHLSPGARNAIRVPESQLPPMFGLWSLAIVLCVSVTLYYMAGRWIWNDAVELIHNISLELTKGY